MASRDQTQAASGASLKPSVVLAKAADLIEPEGAWTQEVFARDGSGRHVDEFGDNAVCWCVLGSIYAQALAAPHDAINVAEGYLRSTVTDGNVASWNDAPERTQAEVVAALRAASELARKEGR